jgi:8-oxo-dGTP diphosphatase
MKYTNRMDINNKMYRVSAKALVYDENKKILLLKEKTGLWELPGGGIEHGNTPHETVRRELKEECGFDVASVADSPKCVWSAHHEQKDIWTLMIAYDTVVAKMDFVPSDECEEYRFVSVEEMRSLPLHKNIEKLPDLLS